MIIDDIKVGNVFGEWTVVDTSDKYDSRHVTCECSCGDRHKIYVYNLTKGFTTKCRRCATSIHSKNLSEMMTVYKPGYQINDNLTITNRYLSNERPKVDIKCKCGNTFSVFSSSISTGKTKCIKCDNALGATYNGKPIDYNDACEILGITRQRVFQLRDSGHLQDRLDGKEIERGRPRKRFQFRGKRFSKEEIMRHFGFSDLYWNKLSQLGLLSDVLAGKHIEVENFMNISNAAMFLGISHNAAKELKDAGHLDSFVCNHIEKVSNSDIHNRLMTFKSVADKWAEFLENREDRDPRGRKGNINIGGFKYTIGDISRVIGVSYYYVNTWVKDGVFDQVWDALLNPSVECDGELVTLDYFANVSGVRLTDAVCSFLNGGLDESC